MERVNENIVRKVVTEDKKVPNMTYKENPSFIIPGSISSSYYVPRQQMFFEGEGEKKDSRINVPTFSVFVESTGSKEDTDTARFNVLRDDFYQ